MIPLTQVKLKAIYPNIKPDKCAVYTNAFNIVLPKEYV